jgi:hypothetical protein
MGLNRFVWAFAASYPALLCTNIAIRTGIGVSVADAITIAAAAVGLLALAVGGGARPAIQPGQLAAAARETRA